MDCREIYRNIQKDIIYGTKVPHRVSMPAIRHIDGEYCFAVFVFYYTKDDLDAAIADRPSLWASVDIASGVITARYHTNEKEFSDASYDIKYSISSDGTAPLSQEEYEHAFRLLDDIRNELLRGAPFPKDTYDKYLNLVLKSIPTDYRRFYLDLSI